MAKKEDRELDDARDFVTETQRRLDRVKGIEDDARSTIQQRLNDLRHSIEAERVERLRSSRTEIETLVERHVEPNEKSTWREYAESIGIAVLLALFLRAFVVEAFKIPTGSMIPTLLVGDHLFVNKFIYGIRVPLTDNYLVRFEQPERGAVVVFSFPTDEARRHLRTKPASQRACIDRASLHQEKDMIKRIVAVAGDTVEVRENQLIINGKPIKRTFLRKEITGNYLYPYEIHEREQMSLDTVYTVRYMGVGKDFGPAKVKPGHVFVMGDNRDNSSDSRCWGQVPVENIKGRAIVIWWSIGEDGIRWERFGQPIR